MLNTQYLGSGGKELENLLFIKQSVYFRYDKMKRSAN
jgi:hypothetical protein